MQTVKPSHHSLWCCGTRQGQEMIKKNKKIKEVIKLTLEWAWKVKLVCNVDPQWKQSDYCYPHFKLHITGLGSTSVAAE